MGLPTEKGQSPNKPSLVDQVAHRALRESRSIVHPAPDIRIPTRTYNGDLIFKRVIVATSENGAAVRVHIRLKKKPSINLN